MKIEEFTDIAQATFTMCLDVLNAKAGKYHQPGADRLGSFKRAGRMLDISPERSLLGMVAKQLQVYIEYLERAERDELNPPLHEWDAVLIDIANYCVLTRALVIERQESFRETVFNAAAACPPEAVPERFRKRLQRKRRTVV